MPTRVPRRGARLTEPTPRRRALWWWLVPNLFVAAGLTWVAGAAGMLAGTLAIAAWAAWAQRRATDPEDRRVARLVLRYALALAGIALLILVLLAPTGDPIAEFEGNSDRTVELPDD
jgi:hypothetical protein